MKTNAIVRIVLFSLAILILLGILLTSLAVGFFMIDFDSFLSLTKDSVNNLPVASDGVTAHGAVGADDIANIEIEWVAGSITIQPVDNTDQINIVESGNDNEKYRMVYQQRGNTLKIQYCEDSITFPSFGLSINAEISKDLVITVPAGWVCDTLEIDAASADVIIRNLQIDEVDFDGASGVCNFENCTVGEIAMDTASGDVDFTGSLDVLDFDGASANCSIYVTNVPRQIDIDTASGDLELYLPEECGFSCDMTTLSGSFSSEFAAAAQNGHHVYGDGSCVINVDAMSGNVSIRKNINAHTNDHSYTHHDE